MAKKQSTNGTHLSRIVICTAIVSILLGGCSHFSGALQATPDFEEANTLFSQGSYQASLHKYEQIIATYPAPRDRVLFEMGVIHAHPKNEQRNYQKALECFQAVIREYPESGYRKDSETMSFYLSTVTVKDATIAAQQALIAAQQTRIEALQHEVTGKDHDILTLQNKIGSLEKKHFAYVLEKGSADKILIEKKDRRLTLFSKGEVLKSYKIALGGNPEGPKERQGDSKTPEGSYVIDARNRGSQYHRSLHISYPNEKDKKRARELGVSPGGDIMIHGLKNGFSWVGEMHTGDDWTKGCIAVTDEEIEEIEKLVPNGTAVEIRP
jgi:tetratricopeptide (TPR) repeat protein